MYMTIYFKGKPPESGNVRDWIINNTGLIAQSGNQMEVQMAAGFVFNILNDATRVDFFEVEHEGFLLKTTKCLGMFFRQ